MLQIQKAQRKEFRTHEGHKNDRRRRAIILTLVVAQKSN